MMVSKFINTRTLTFLLIIVFFFSCSNPNSKTVKIILNPKNVGWYFIQLIRDSTIKDTGIVYIKFNDTAKLIVVRLNHIEKTILSPYDTLGNSLSGRLKYLGLKEIGGKKTFFEFYNPSDEELFNIDKWMPTNKRALQIQNDELSEFNKYYKIDKK